MRIGDVLRKLTDGQQARIARKRGVKIRGLANSYGDDWVQLVKDMKRNELRHLLGTLTDEQLRIVVLRAFDGRTTELDDISWNESGEAKRRWKARSVVEALCNWGPDRLQEKTWETVITAMLRDVGLDSEETPTGNDDLVRLRRIFSR